MADEPGSVPPATSLQPQVALKLHHIGCAVRNIERAVGYYTKALGFKRVTEAVEVASQKVKVCFLEPSSASGTAPFLELVEGVGAGSPVEKLIETTGGGPYHLCYEVDDLDAGIKWLRSQGFFRLTRFEAKAHGMQRFAFMLTPDRQLMELCEKDKTAIADARG